MENKNIEQDSTLQIKIRSLFNNHIENKEMISEKKESWPYKQAIEYEEKILKRELRNCKTKQAVQRLETAHV